MYLFRGLKVLKTPYLQRFKYHFAASPPFTEMFASFHEEIDLGQHLIYYAMASLGFIIIPCYLEFSYRSYAFILDYSLLHHQYRYPVPEL